MSSPRVLWVGALHPHPPRAGLTAYTAQLTASLARAGAEVHGMGLAVPGTPHHDGPLVPWEQVPGGRRRRLTGLASPLPSMAFANGTAAYRSRLESRLITDGPWQAVVLDHLITGWALDLLDTGQAQSPVLVHVSHNHETSVRADVARREPRLSPRRALLGLDAAKIARLEDRVVRRSQVVTTITTRDRDLFAPRARATPIVLPPGWTGTPAAERRITADTPRRVVVLGQWDWHVKQRNLEMFVAVADPLFAVAGVELVVVGPAPDSWIKRMQRTLRATRFTGWVDEVAEVFSGARLALVTEPAGGGFKLKSLDYVYNRVPMAVLEGSMTGLPLTPGVHYLQSPTEAALTADILPLLDDLDRLNAMQDSSFHACSTMLGTDKQGLQLCSAIEEARRRASA